MFDWESESGDDDEDHSSDEYECDGVYPYHEGVRYNVMTLKTLERVREIYKTSRGVMNTFTLEDTIISCSENEVIKTLDSLKNINEVFFRFNPDEACPFPSFFEKLAGCKFITKLRFCDVVVDGEWPTALFANLDTSNIRHMTFNKCSLYCNAEISLGKAIARDCPLESLDFHETEIDSRGFDSIIRGLATNTHLREFKTLYTTGSQWNICTQFVESLAQNTGLRLFSLYHDWHFLNMFDAIGRILERNHTLQAFHLFGEPENVNVDGLIRGIRANRGLRDLRIMVEAMTNTEIDAVFDAVAEISATSALTEVQFYKYRHPYNLSSIHRMVRKNHNIVDVNLMCTYEGRRLRYDYRDTLMAVRHNPTLLTFPSFNMDSKQSKALYSLLFRNKENAKKRAFSLAALAWLKFKPAARKERLARARSTKQQRKNIATTCTHHLDEQRLNHFN
jgi:hypothetical protein